jgi:CHAT domain-containing protein
MAKRALEIRERALGPQHPDTEATRLSVASIGSPMGEDRLVVLEDALVRLEKSFGADHPETAAGLNNLASYYSSLGNDAKALPLHERALAICENVLGPQHPNTAATLNFLAKVQYKSGDIATARSYASRQVAAKHRELESILALDEATRLAWQAKNLSFWHACVLRPEPLGQVVLRLKGVVLDSLLEDRSLALSAKDDPNSEAILKEIAELRGQLSAIAFDTGNQDAAEVLEQRIAQLQRSLATRATAAGRVRASADITFDAIFPALGQYAAFVDFIRFEDPKLKGDDATCYGAVITGSDGSPLFVRIDGGAAIDNAIDTLRSAINQRQDQEVEAQTKFLSEKLWQPIAAKIPEGTKQVIICPDAKLNFLAFGSLLESDGRFVAEKFPIAYMGSGRDLTRKPSIEAAKSLVVFADPVFDASGKVSSAKEMVAMRSAEADVFGAINLPPLPGTKAEAEQLEVIAAGAGWDIKTTTGDEATESSVREAKKPGVLHLATHGFYLNSFSPPAENGTRGMSVVGFNNEEDKKQNENGVDPMRASGVALTGAQQTLKLWSQRKAPDPKTDGILTAEEVASLDLNGTWLVTLSACETGVGEARSGEGVFGLRRAFMMAGAENLLMTLWPVSDDTTASIMADFYTEALATGDAPGSLAKVQRDWLVKLREEKGLATAIREAGPFAMVMMTAPTHPPVELPPVANLEAKDTSTPATTTQPAGEASSE